MYRVTRTVTPWVPRVWVPYASWTFDFMKSGSAGLCSGCVGNAGTGTGTFVSNIR